MCFHAYVVDPMCKGRFLFFHRRGRKILGRVQVMCNMPFLMLGRSMKCQGAFHVVNLKDLWCEIELLLGMEAYTLLPWRGGATIFCFTRCKCWRDGVFKFQSKFNWPVSILH